MPPPSSNNRDSIMNKTKLAVASLMAMVFFNAYADGVLVEAGGTYTATGSPVQSVTTGASTATGGTSSSTTGDSTSSGNTSGNTSVTSNYAAPKIPVATAIAPANLPTAPCMGATSIGVSAVLFGFSTGSSWEATECMTLEMARSFSQDGQLEDAQAVRCSSKYAANAPSCIKLLQKQVAGKPVASNISYIETIDPVTGFKTIIDTRDSFRRPASH